MPDRPDLDDDDVTRLHDEIHSLIPKLMDGTEDLISALCHRVAEILEIDVVQVDLAFSIMVGGYNYGMGATCSGLPAALALSRASDMALASAAKEHLARMIPPPNLN